VPAACNESVPLAHAKRESYTARVIWMCYIYVARVSNAGMNDRLKRLDRQIKNVSSIEDSQ
jgi:hypothetical protein